MHSLVMSPFSHDYKKEIELTVWLVEFNLITCVQYSHRAWFLDVEYRYT